MATCVGGGFGEGTTSRGGGHEREEHEGDGGGGGGGAGHRWSLGERLRYVWVVCVQVVDVWVTASRRYRRVIVFLRIISRRLIDHFLELLFYGNMISRKYCPCRNLIGGSAIKR